MSQQHDRLWLHLYREVQKLITTHWDNATGGIITGGKVDAGAVAGTLPTGTMLHAMQSQAHTDVDHTTAPNNGDVLVWDATRQVWTPSAVAAAGAGSPETLVIPGDPPDPVVADGDYIYVAFS